MLTKNKSGRVFAIIFLAILFYGGLVTLLLVKMNTMENQFPDKIGAQQREIIKDFYKSEYTLFYLEKSADYALQKTLVKINENGGISDDIHKNLKPLGYKRNYPVRIRINQTSTNTISVFPNYDIIVESIQHEFNKELQSYLENHKELPSLNYILSTDENKISFHTQKNIDFGAAHIKYLRNPSFSLKIDYNTDDYKKIIKGQNLIIQTLQRCTSDCKTKIVESLDTLNLDWNIDMDSKYIYSDIILDKETTVYDTGIKTKPNTFKFAIEYK